MNELVLADRAAEWRRLKSLVLDGAGHSIGQFILLDVLARKGFVNGELLRRSPGSFGRWRRYAWSRGNGSQNAVFDQCPSGRK
jgi:hypothetical protein